MHACMGENRGKKRKKEEGSRLHGCPVHRDGRKKEEMRFRLHGSTEEKTQRLMRTESEKEMV